MCLNIVGELFSRVWGKPPSLHQTTQEAAQQYLANQAKLETATDAVLVGDFNELAAAERQRVQEYTDWKVFGRKPGTNGTARRRNGVGNVTVCDNIYNGLGPIGTATVALATIAGITATVLGLGYVLKEPTQEQIQPPAAEYVDTTSSIEIEGGQPTLEW